MFKFLLYLLYTAVVKETSVKFIVIIQLYNQLHNMLEIQEILLIVLAVISTLILLFCIINICYFLWIRCQSRSSGIFKILFRRIIKIQRKLCNNSNGRKLCCLWNFLKNKIFS